MERDLIQEKIEKERMRPIISYFVVSFIFLFIISGLLYYERLAQNRYVDRIQESLSLQTVDSLNLELLKDHSELDLSAKLGGVIIAIYFILVVLIFLGIRRRFLKPLMKLRQDIKKISSSNYEYKVETSPDTEFGYIYDFIKNVNAYIRDTKTTIENSNIQRGRELDKVIAKLWKENLEMETKEVALSNLLKESRLLEEQLKEEKDFINAIIGCMDEGLLTADSKGKLTFINKSAEQMLEIKSEESLGKPLDEVAPLFYGTSFEKQLSLSERPIMKAYDTGKAMTTSLSDDYCFITKSGKKIAVIISSSPLLSGDKIVGSVATFRNVNTEKTLDEAKNGFISIASHQMRTPLTSMRWFSEMLISKDAGVLNREQKQYIEQIYRGILRMTSLLDLLLQIARVEAGRVKIEPTLIDFKEYIQSTEATLSPMINKKQQTVNIVLKPADFPKIAMDKEMVWQVFFNLLSNATRYAPIKGIVTVTGKIIDDMAEFSVADNGIGIPKEAHEKIFSKFYRAGNAIKLVPEGSGLGLYLVKSLVEGWGGKIWFKSIKNKGTTFYFTIPLSGMMPREGEVGLKV